MTAKRVLISINERLLDRIDAEVRRRGLTRSGYLAQLASADIESTVGAGNQPAITARRKVDDLYRE